MVFQFRQTMGLSSTSYIPKENMILKLIITAIITFLGTNISAQSNSSWTYRDLKGNILMIENYLDLPDKLDTLTFKDAGIFKQVTGALQYSAIVITDVKRIKKNKKYDIKIFKIPIKGTIEDALKTQGYSHYLCTVRKTISGSLEIISILFSYSEI